MAWKMWRVYAGVTLDIPLTPVSDQAAAKNLTRAKERLRFRSPAERARHRMNMARRHFVRLVNNTFVPGDLYATLTFDDEHEVHTFDDAKRIRGLIRRKLRRACPEGNFVIVMGRGKSTNRIHMHIVAHGVPQETLERLWTWGAVLAPRPLREHNYFVGEDGQKVDHGADFTGLATYLFHHWTEEQGGHYYMASGAMRQPEPEPPERVEWQYSDRQPPEAPPGYVYIGRDATPFGYYCYHYIWDPKTADREAAALSADWQT